MIDLSNVPLSPARRAGDLLFLAGQLALEDGEIREPGIEGQTRQVMRNIETVLARHDLGFADVVNATVWLSHEEDFAGFNAAYAAYFPELPPARTTVVSKLMLGARIEIAVVAYFG